MFPLMLLLLIPNCCFLQPPFVPCLPQPTLSDETVMRIALKEAENAGKRGEVPVGAAVYGPDGSLLSRLETNYEKKIFSCFGLGLTLSHYFTRYSGIVIVVVLLHFSTILFSSMGCIPRDSSLSLSLSHTHCMVDHIRRKLCLSICNLYTAVV